MDDASWTALAGSLLVLGAIATWAAYKRRGARAGTRWLAITLLVPAAYFTKTLQMFGEITDAVIDWATRFVWNPLVWVGLGFTVLAVLVFLLSMRIPPRAGKAKPGGKAKGTPAAGAGSAPAGQVGAGQRGEPMVDDLDDIEAILKRHGIS
ncbi:hypothetical protein [Nocardioides insulae]|uniref:hypothetical protein n=1 Tax=Nocardioides insulae TaxID=394734 RepID=UPI0003FC9EFF|nr:hypothetical protein [Nocardioides insulae]